MRDELLPDGSLACDECGKPASVFFVPVEAMRMVYRDMNLKACADCGATYKVMRSFQETTEKEYRRIEDWPPLAEG